MENQFNKIISGIDINHQDVVNDIIKLEYEQYKDVVRKYYNRNSRSIDFFINNNLMKERVLNLNGECYTYLPEYDFNLLKSK